MPSTSGTRIRPPDVEDVADRQRQHGRGRQALQGVGDGHHGENGSPSEAEVRAGRTLAQAGGGAGGAAWTSARPPPPPVVAAP